MLVSSNGTILFQLIDKLSPHDLAGDFNTNTETSLPKYFQFELDMKVKTVKVGNLRLFG